MLSPETPQRDIVTVGEAICMEPNEEVSLDIDGCIRLMPRTSTFDDGVLDEFFSPGIMKS